MTSDADAARIRSAAATIDVPKAAEPDSFVLHAPMELLARALLLDRVPAPTRAAALDRIRTLTEASGLAAEVLDEPLRSRRDPVEAVRGIFADATLMTNKAPVPAAL